MGEQNQKINDFLTTSEPHVDKPKISIVEEKNGKYAIFSPSSEQLAKIRVSGHHLKWEFRIEGQTFRTPKKRVKMRNWNKDIYYWKGATIVLNPRTMEVWLKSRPYKPTMRSSGVLRMIGANWAKADLIAREFSEFAEIAITPVKTAHPLDISKAHLVITSKEFNSILKPMSAIKDEVGLHFDKSHPNLPEFVGPKSVEGAQGAEWFFTKFPAIVQYQIEMDRRFAENLELHLSVLKEIRDAIKELRERK